MGDKAIITALVVAAVINQSHQEDMPFPIDDNPTLKCWTCKLPHNSVVNSTTCRLKACWRSGDVCLKFTRKLQSVETCYHYTT